MKKSLFTLTAVAILLPMAVSCSGSKDIAKTNPTTTHSAPTASTTPTTPTTSTPPEDSGRLEGTGYSVGIPSGWEDITSTVKAQNASLDIALGESHPSGFRTNFNVVASTATTASIGTDDAALRAEAAKELKSVTHTTVGQIPDTTVGGDAAIGQTSTFVSSGTKLTFLQYFVIHNGRAYPITMTFATPNLAKAKGLLTTILGSWRWDD